MVNPGRRSWFVLVLAVLAFVGYTTFARRGTETPEAFKQVATLAESEALAAESGMPVLVFATADWCGPCQTFKRQALADAGVQRWIRENTHPVIADFTDREKPPEGAERLRVKSLPTLLLMRDGKEVSRLGGVVPAKALLAWLGEHSGPIADWAHANPGQPMPEVPLGPVRKRTSAIGVPPAPPE